MSEIVEKAKIHSESPDTVHGRLLEAAHMSGYTKERAYWELEWLLEDDKWKTVGKGFEEIDGFLATLSSFKVDTENRKKLSSKLESLRATQRATARLLEVSQMTVSRDLETDVSKQEKTRTENVESETIVSTPFSKSGDDIIKAEKSEVASTEKKINREIEIEEIKASPVVDPGGKYDTVIIDPPWPYGTKYDPNGRRAANPYPEMSIEEISNLDTHTKDDSIIWLWTTHKFLRHSFALLDTWEFRDVSILTWVKDRMGLGTWLRSQTEFCIMAVKGSPVIDLSNQTTVIYGAMREHSRKPDEFYDMVKELCPGSILDWFSREAREGIASGGKEVDKF